jgi:hypothetical protein
MTTKNKMINKILKLNLVILLLITFFISNIFAADFLSSNSEKFEIVSFDVLLDINSPNNAKVIEYWKFNFDSEQDIINFKEQIFAANINISKLKEINSELEPHVYINDYKNVKIGFDELEKVVRIEYTIEDLCLIQYLDYDNEIIWKLNENLFRHFVNNNLYDIPKDSYLKVKFYEPLIFGESLPAVEVNSSDLVSWTGVSSNELRLIVIEKKPPKPSFVISDFLDDKNNLKVFIIGSFILILLIIILLIFKDKFFKKINAFVIRHSKLNTRKSNSEIINSQYFNR